MREQAEQLGFVFSRYGCPCNGRPMIFTIKKGEHIQTLSIWERREAWQLKSRGLLLASGKASEMETKIKAIWD